MLFFWIGRDGWDTREFPIIRFSDLYHVTFPSQKYAKETLQLLPTGKLLSHQLLAQPYWERIRESQHAHFLRIK